jgi:hypothetical protein
MMFPKHDWLGWTPEKRVMENVREATFEFSPKANCEMICLGVNNEQIQLARKDGHIDFEKSKVKQSPVVYHLDYGSMDLSIALNDSVAVLQTITMEGKTCNCP